MPIDPSIPLTGRPAQFNLGDMFSSMQNMQQMQMNRRQMQAFDLQAQQRDQALRDDSAMRFAVQKHTGEDGTVAWDDAIGELNGHGFVQAGMALQKNVTAQREARAKAIKEESEATGAQFALTAQALQGVTDEASYQRAMGTISRLPIIAPLAQQFFGDAYDPEKVKQAIGFGMKAKEYADVQKDAIEMGQKAVKLGNETAESRAQQFDLFTKAASRIFSVAQGPEAWAKVQSTVGELAGSMAPMVLKQFGAAWSPEAQASAAQVGIAPEKRAELAGQAEGRAITAAGQRETARHDRVTEGLSAAAGKREQERLDLTYGTGVGKEGTPENATAKAIAEYRMPPVSARSMASGPGRALMDQVMALNPAYDGTQFPARSKMVTSFTSGPQAQTLNSLNTAIEHLDQFTDAAKALGNGNFRPGNEAYNWFRETFGGSKPTNFEGIKTIMAGELASAFKKSGATDTEIENVEKSINKANSTGQLVDYATKVAIPALGSKANAFREQFQSLMGEKDPLASKLLSPSARKVLAKHGYDPDHPTMGGAPPAAGGGKEEIVEQGGHQYRIKRDAAGNFLSATPVGH